MKKIVSLFFVLIVTMFTFTVNAQDTISKEMKSYDLVLKSRLTPSQQEMYSYDFQKMKDFAYVDTVKNYEYTLRVDPSYIQGEYIRRAGNMFTSAGVCLSLSVVSGVSTVFLPVKIDDKTGKDGNEIPRYGLMVISSGLFVSSVVCFLVGSHDLSKAGMIIKEGKNRKYIITTNGSNIKFNF